MNRKAPRKPTTMTLTRAFEHAARPAQDAVADDAAYCVADNARKEDARGEDRRLFDIEIELVKKVGGDPVEEQPQRPAVAEVGQR